MALTSFRDGQLVHNGRFAALHGELRASSWQEEYRSTKDPRYTVGMATISGGRTLNGRHAHELSRALLKVGFGCAWIDQGDNLLGAEFDGIRDAILGSSRREGFIFVGNEVDQSNTTIDVRFNALADEAGDVSLRVLANIYGVAMLTDSREATPPRELHELGTVGLFVA